MGSCDGDGLLRLDVLVAVSSAVAPDTVMLGVGPVAVGVGCVGVPYDIVSDTEAVAVASCVATERETVNEGRERDGVRDGEIEGDG